MTSLPMFRAETLRAIEAVQRGVEIAEAGFGRQDVTYKEGRDVVTQADVAVEDAMREMLSSAFAYPVVGEERGGRAPVNGAPYWLIDPICGTRNYASGLPLYCTNLALVERNEVTIAVVGDPLAGEVCVAELRGGAWAVKDGQWRRLAVSDDSRVIVVEEGKSVGMRRELAVRFLAAVLRADRWDFRSLASTVSYPQLAAGRVAAYVTAYGGIEHIAAGTLLAQEAGATVTQVDGRAWSVKSDSLIAAATPELHAELLAIARTSGF